VKLRDFILGYEEVAEFPTEDGSLILTDPILELIRLQQEEGVVDLLGFAYHHAAMCVRKIGNIPKAREWSDMEMEVIIYCLGRDSPKAKILGD